MKSKTIFEHTSMYSHDKALQSFSTLFFIIVFSFVIIVYIPSSDTEAQNIDENIFISNTSNYNNNVHWLFRQKPSQEQSDYLWYFYYDPIKWLAAVAKEYNVSIEQILDLNSLSSESIIPENMLMYITTIPGKVIVNSMKDQTLEDFIQSLAIEKEKELITYNGGKKEEILLYGTPILIPFSAFQDQNIDKELLQATDSAIYELTLAEYEDQMNRNSEMSRSIIANSSKQNIPLSQFSGSRSSILKARRPYIKEDNGMVPGHCTYYAAHRAKLLFPEIRPGVRKKIIRWNANQWIKSAKANWLTTSTTPSVGAVVVFQNWWSNFFNAGHVSIVESVDWDAKTVIVSDMNYAGLWIVTERIVYLSDDMTEAVSSSQNIIGFIPAQELPEHLRE